MFGLLYQYFVENRNLYLRGTGQLNMVQQSAGFDVANQLLHAPHSTIELRNSQQEGSLQHLMAFISRQLDIAEEQAFSLYSFFCNQLHQDIENNKPVSWHNLGTFKKDAAGNTVFIMDTVIDSYREALPAKRIIRENTAHNIKIGTLETTNIAVLELLAQSDEELVMVKSRWWIGAIILGAIAITLIILRKMQLL